MGKIMNDIVLDIPVARIPTVPAASQRLFNGTPHLYPASLRKALASALVILMVLALVTRGVAAPLIHLQSEMPAPAQAASFVHHKHAHADCEGGEMDVANAADVEAGPAVSHGGQAKHGHQPLKHSKVCDANGACCGALALSDTSEGAPGFDSSPDPARNIVSAGVKPTNPDRPPSPPLA